MNRIGYGVLLALIIAMVLWLAWPRTDVPHAGERPFTEAFPVRFTLKANGLEQSVNSNVVTLSGANSAALERPLDVNKSKNLFRQFRQMVTKRVKDGVGAGDLAAYGIDGTQVLDAFDYALWWGSTDDATYVWRQDKKRIYHFEAGVYAAIQRAARRLDNPRYLPGDLGGESLQIDTLQLAINTSRAQWLAEGESDRPPFGARIDRLFQVIRRISLSDLNGQLPPGARLVHSIGFPSDTAGETDSGLRALQIHEHESDWWVAFESLPAQRLSTSLKSQIGGRILAFAEDPLFDLSTPRGSQPVNRIVFEKGAQPWFTLRRTGEEDVFQGKSNWAVSWPGGLETAVGDVPQRMIRALNAIRVQQPYVISEAERKNINGGPDSWRMQLYTETGALFAVVLFDGEQVWSYTHRGVVASLPEDLQEISPSSFLDNKVIGLSPERVQWFQRVTHAASGEDQAEVFGRESQQSWQRLFPRAEAVDGRAVEQVLRTLAVLKGEDVRLATDSDREILTAPERSVALRILGKGDVGGREAEDLLDTIDRDWALFLRKEADSWRAIELNGTQSFLLSEAAVSSLFADLLQDALLPMAVSLLQSVEVQRADNESYLLTAQGEGEWQVRAGSELTTADRIEVRRWLQDFARIQVQEYQPNSVPLIEGDSEARIICTAPLPGGGIETLFFSIGAEENGMRAVSVRSSSAETVLPQGRMIVSADALNVLLSPVSRFQPAE